VALAGRVSMQRCPQTIECGAYRRDLAQRRIGIPFGWHILLAIYIVGILNYAPVFC
jgi:hypothetical protein